MVFERSNMTPRFTQDGIDIYLGDCRSVLKELPEQSVQCCVTSPPYWGLRDYGVDGQLGLEQTPEQYVAEMVAVFAEVRRVLMEDGTLWLNIGDSYAAASKDRTVEQATARCTLRGNPQGNAQILKQQNKVVAGLKPKDLVGIPWMLAFALRSDGWYLRSDTIWAKPNGMPESVQDRPVRSHEYVFLLSKSERYLYNYDAVRLPPLPSSTKRLEQHIEAQEGSQRANGGSKTNGTMKAVTRKTDKQRGHSRRHDGFNDRWDQMERDEQMEGGAALRDVWWLAPAQTKDSHFAVMPEKLATICVLAGSGPNDTVLDPFNGSGTTGAVCRKWGRRYIGIELNEKYIDLSVKRFEQPLLFSAGVPA
jgi:DNA modification methylase